jgi:hypothetical protein
VNITYIYSEDERNWVRSDWRCQTPFRALNQTKRHKAFLLNELDFNSKTGNSKEICDRSDVLIIQNNLWGEKLAELQHWCAKGKHFILDLDGEDFLNLKQSGNPRKKQIKHTAHTRSGFESQISNYMQFQWGLHLVNGVTAPSRKLVEDWNQLTKIEVLLDYIDVEKYHNAPYIDHDDIIIGWTGKKVQLEGLKENGLLDVIKEVCLLRPRVKFLVSCEVADYTLNVDFPVSRYLFRAKEKVGWPKPLSMIDIGLVPVVSEIDHYQGRANILEYLVMKVPWIGSKSASLYDLRNYGWLVENQTEKWKDLLLDMIDHLSDYKEHAARESYLYGIGQNIHENIQHLADTYVKIMNTSQLN